jgi:hypothetical protein
MIRIVCDYPVREMLTIVIDHYGLDSITINVGGEEIAFRWKNTIGNEYWYVCKEQVDIKKLKTVAYNY